MYYLWTQAYVVKNFLDWNDTYYCQDNGYLKAIGGSADFVNMGMNKKVDGGLQQIP